MAGKNLKIGSLMVTEYEGNKLVSIGLGNKGKNAQYDLSVELVVKDSTGKVVARQTDGFLNLIDPRTQPDELLAKNLITEEVANKMKAGVAKLSDKVKYNVMIKG